MVAECAQALGYLAAAGTRSGGTVDSSAANSDAASSGVEARGAAAGIVLQVGLQQWAVCWFSCVKCSRKANFA